MIDSGCQIIDFNFPDAGSTNPNWHNCSTTSIPHNPSIDPTAIKRVYNNQTLISEEVVSISSPQEYFTLINYGCSSATHSYGFQIIIEPSGAYGGSTSFSSNVLYLECCDAEETKATSSTVILRGAIPPIRVERQAFYTYNTLCFSPDYTLCTNVEKIDMPLKITLNVGKRSDKCFSSSLQDLVYKYTGQYLNVKGFISDIDVGRILSATVGTDKTNISKKLIQVGYPDSNEKASSCANDLGKTAKIDSVNKCYYFVKNVDSRYINSYTLRISSDITESFFYTSSGNEIKTIANNITVSESEDDKLYFSISMSYLSNLRNTLQYYTYTSDRIEVKNISDFFERIVLLGNSPSDYQLTELY